MKKLLWTSISLITGLSLVLLFISATVPTAQAAQLAQAGGGDPEPVINLPQTGTGYTPEAVEAVLQPAWSSPNADFTNQVAWGDYDQDGDLDLLTGNSGENRLYQNDGNPTLPTLTEIETLVCQTPASNTTQSVEWGDYDQDGDLDIAIGNSNNRNCVLQNNNGSFDLAWLSDVILDTRSVAFAGWEYNDEFSMYLAIGNGSEPTNVYRFEGGTFDLWWTETSVYATNVVAWGDYDNDGDPDLVLGNFGQPNRLYRNDRNTLTYVQNLPNTLNTRDLALGDMNGDGYLDLAQGNGQSLGNANTARVYCNSGSPAFTFAQCWEAAEAVSTFNVAWGDYEGDGDLDLALSSEENGVTRIYENDANTLGTDPIWDADDDAQNSRAVAWADWNGDGDLEFTVGYLNGTTQIYENTAGVFQSTSYGPEIYDSRSVAWGDYDNDGDFDLAVGNSSSAPSLVYENESATLTLAFTAPVAENTRSVAWGDYDGDGDLDLALGNGATGTGQSNRLYENVNGNLSISPDFFDPFPSNTYAVAWGDYDGDGDLDLASGNYEAFQAVQIHRNVGGIFTTTISVGGTSSDLTLDLAAGDFDQDFDLDLVIANDNGPNRVLINNGSGGFTIQTLPEPDGACFISPGSDTWSVAWGDYDGDGDLDIAAGHAGFSGCIQIIESEFSDGAWNFTTVYQSTDTSLDVRAVEWGDWDGDGDFDLAVGISGSFGRRNRIYRNDNGTFTLAWVAPNAEADTTRGIAWGDADNDGDLDLATANGLSPENPNRLYLNNWKQSSNLPNDPIRAELLRPEGTGDAYFFSTAEIQGQPTIYVPFYLSDDEGDPAYLVEFQVSWDGGGSWEPACAVGEDCNFPSGIWLDVPTLNNGVKSLYYFQWNALYHLLAHQNLTLYYDDGQFVPNDKSDEEMDVAFRIVPHSNPYHGGLVQRPEFGGSSTLNRVDMRPEWHATKTHIPEYGIPGELMHYTIQVAQADHGMPPAYIIDQVPDFMDLVGFPGSNYGVVTTTHEIITWTNFIWFEELFPWDLRVDNTDAIEYPQTLNLDYYTLIQRPLTNGLVITNTALIFDGLHEPYQITSTVTISSSPTLTESWKLVNHQPENNAVPGETMTYTIVLTNTGTENAYDVLMSDVIPDEVNWGGNLSFSSGAASFNTSDNTLTWTGPVKVFQPVYITFTVVLDTQLVGLPFTNTFEIQHSSIITPFISTPVTTTVMAPNFLPSAKTATTDTVELGDVLTYTILIENIGTTDAYSVTLTDPMPGASTYISGSFTASDGFGGYNPDTDAIEWSADFIPTGNDAIALSFAVIVGLLDQPTPPILTNTATLADPISGEYPLVHTATVLLPDFSPSSKTGSADEVSLGDVLTYTILLENDGGRSPITTLTDTIPGGSTFISGTLIATEGMVTYTEETNQIEWIGDMAGGETISITFAITVGAPLTNPVNFVTNLARVEDDVAYETWLPESTLILAPDLASSSKTASSTQVELGDLLTYTISINNTGANAPGVLMTDVLTVGLDYVEGSFTSTVGMGGYTPETGVIWTGDVGAGESAQVQFTVIVACPLTGTLLTNSALIEDSLGFTTTVSTASSLFLPDLSDSLLTANLSRVQVGSSLTYQLTIRNTGGNAPFASMATLPLSGQTYISATATTGEIAYNPATKVVTWDGALTTAQEVFITIQVQVTSPLGVSLTAVLDTGCASTELSLTIPGAGIFLPIVKRE